MTSTDQRKEYLRRFKAQGFNRSSWAFHVGVSRKTVERQVSGRITVIKRTFWLALDALDGLGVPSNNGERDDNS